MKQVLAALAVVLLTQAPVMAQKSTPQKYCGDRNSIVQVLENKYHEVRRFAAVTAGESLLELYASDESGSWSRVQTLGTGRACLISSGNGFVIDEPELGNPA